MLDDQTEPQLVTHLQVAPGFRLRRAIDAAADEDVEKPFTDEYHHFCLGSHLKGVCSSKYDGRHLHRKMSQGEMGWMTVRKESF